MDFLPGNNTMTTRQISFLLLAVFLLLYILPLGARPLFIPDETRYAEVPREMIESGDWVVPHLNGLRYFEKPVMGYWLSAISLLTFGENNFGIRFPMAVTAGLTAFLLFLFCKSVFPFRSESIWLAPLILLTSFGVATIGTIAVLDNALTFFLTATLITFFWASEQQAASGRERSLLFLSGLLAGCAFLTKGFLAFAVPVLTVAPYLIQQKRGRDCLRLLPLILLGALLVSLPWAVLIHQREADFWNYFFFTEHVHRFLADDAQHREVFWFFLAALPFLFLPWSFIAPTALKELLEHKPSDQAQSRLLSFCCCWLLFPLLFFSISKGKLLTYILPCFPPLAILTALGLELGWQQERLKKWFNRGVLMTIILFAAFLIALPLFQLIGPEEYQPYSTPWKWLLLCGCLFLTVITLFASLQAQQWLPKIILFTLAPLSLLMILPFSLPQQILGIKAPGPLFEKYATTIDNRTLIMSGEETARAAAWYFKRDDIVLIERGGELDYGLKYEDARQRLLSPEAAGDTIRSRHHPVLLVVEEDEYDHWHTSLPTPTEMDRMGKFMVLFYR